MAPLRPRVLAPEFSLEPSDVALGIFPGGEPARARERAEEGKEIWTSANIDHIERGAERRRRFHGGNREANDAVIVGRRLAVVMLKIGFGVELSPAIVCVARRRARGLIRRWRLGRQERAPAKRSYMAS